MWPRGQNYADLRGVTEGRDVVAWYWRIVALGSSVIILGGFLMLPITFDHSTDLKASATAVGIFAVVLLVAGWILTALLSFAVRTAIFQAESIFMPAMIACLLGLLTVFYDLLVYKRYHWNLPALLVTIAGAMSTVIYGVLVLYTYRKIHLAKAGNGSSIPLTGAAVESESALWQEPAYYENYIRNMFPTSARQPLPPGIFDPNAITEEEMQRQQMLMLLLQKEQPLAHAPSSSTFRIDWQGGPDEEAPPAHGYYAPLSSPAPTTAYPGPSPAISRQATNGLQPWDGVWRTPVAARIQPAVISRHGRVNREERRREIEMGK